MLAAAAISAACLAYGCGNDDVRHRAATTANPVEVFAPLVRLHPRERSYPAAVDRHLEGAALWWADDSGCEDSLVAARVDPAKLGDGGYRQRRLNERCRQIERAYTTNEPAHPYVPARKRNGLAEGEGFYLDTTSAAGTSDPSAQPDERARIPLSTPIYYDVTSATVDGEAGTQISYWSFFPRGVGTWLEWWDDDHGGRYWGRDRIVRDGDWERVDVLARRDGDRWIPVTLRTHSETGVLDTPWTDVQHFDGTHPVLYSALASHTPYVRPGFHQTQHLVSTGNYVIADDTVRCRGCPHWRTWQRLVDAREQPWYGYGGAWGPDRGTPGRTGSAGPGAAVPSGSTLRNPGVRSNLGAPNAEVLSK